jgi:hypothetical protein
MILPSYPATFAARPEPGETVMDPQFGVTIRRIADGEYFIVWWAAEILALDRRGHVVNVIGNPEYSHLALGRLSTPTITADFYWKNAFDLPYPTRGSLTGIPCLAYPIFLVISRQTLLSGAAMNMAESASNGSAKKSPSTGTIRKPAKATIKASASNIIPTILLDNLSRKQSILSISFS